MTRQKVPWMRKLTKSVARKMAAQRKSSADARPRLPAAPRAWRCAKATARPRRIARFLCGRNPMERNAKAGAAGMGFALADPGA